MNGFLLIDKPKGITSQGVVAKIKRQFQLNKCGHTGTLDPDATGLLVVACGMATKTIPLLEEKEKKYLTTIVFGLDSNTLDVYGEITQEIKMNFSLEELDNALDQLKTQTSQIPPMISAIKVHGKKLYEYARKNQEVEVESRPIKIFKIEKKSELRCSNGHLEIDLEITCSKGFYVRSFARDLGKVLKGCAIIKELRRLKSGDFSIENAVSLDQVTKENTISIETVFSHFRTLEVNDYIAKLVKNGVVLDERQIKTTEPFYIKHNCDIIAIYAPVEKYRYKPVLLFQER